MGRGSGLLCALLAGTVLAACGDDGARETRNARRHADAEPIRRHRDRQRTAAQDRRFGAAERRPVDEPRLGHRRCRGRSQRRIAGARSRGIRLVIVRQDDGCGDAEKGGRRRAIAGRAMPPLRASWARCARRGRRRPTACTTCAHIVHILPSATRADLSQQDERFFFRIAWLDEAQVGRTGGVRAGQPARDDRSADRRCGTVRAGRSRRRSRPPSKAPAATYRSRERIERGDTDFAALARRGEERKPGRSGVRGAQSGGRADRAGASERGLHRRVHRAGRRAERARLHRCHARQDTGVSAADGAIVTGGRTPDATISSRASQTRFSARPAPRSCCRRTTPPRRC